MITKLFQALKQRRINNEFLLLELDEMKAHAAAEFMVVRAQRALDDAHVRAERMNDDAQMFKRWEKQKLDIQQQHLNRAKLPRQEENFVSFPMPVDMPVSKVVPITKES
jgi:hypothetical protein